MESSKQKITFQQSKNNSVENKEFSEKVEKDELEKIKANLPVMSWEAQYQQQPTSQEGAIIKREWWKMWEKEAESGHETKRSGNDYHTGLSRSKFTGDAKYSYVNLLGDSLYIKFNKMFPIKKIRADFPILQRKVKHGDKLGMGMTYGRGRC